MNWTKHDARQGFTFVWLLLVFSSCLICKTIIFGIMTKMERARALKCWCLGCSSDRIFSLLIYCLFRPGHCSKFMAIWKKNYFKITFICCKFLVSSIGNPEQPREFLRNLTKPEVISSKGPDFVLQPVKIAKLFLSRS